MSKFNLGGIFKRKNPLLIEKRGVQVLANRWEPHITRIWRRLVWSSAPPRVASFLPHQLRSDVDLTSTGGKYLDFLLIWMRSYCVLCIFIFLWICDVLAYCVLSYSCGSNFLCALDLWCASQFFCKLRVGHSVSATGLVIWVLLIAMLLFI